MSGTRKLSCLTSVALIGAFVFGGCTSEEDARCQDILARINGCLAGQSTVDETACDASLLEAYDEVVNADCSTLSAFATGDNDLGAAKTDRYGGGSGFASMCGPWQKRCGTFSQQCCVTSEAYPRENEYPCITVTEQHCDYLFSPRAGTDHWPTDKPITRFGITKDLTGFGTSYVKVVGNPVGEGGMRIKWQAGAMGCATYMVHAFCKLDWPTPEDPEYCEMFPDDCE